MMVAMNPQTWDAGRGRDRARRLPVLRQHAAAAAERVPRRRQRHRHAADRDLQRHLHDPRQRQLFKNIIYVGALSVLLDIDAGGDREPVRRAVQGQGAAAGVERARAAPGPRLRARAPGSAAGRACACSGATRSASASSSTATAPRRWAASTAAPRCAPGTRSRRRRRWPRRSRSTARKFRVDPATGAAPLRHRAGRGRDRLDRHGRRRGLERRARLHRHLGPGRVADDRVHRPGLLRRDPGDHHQRAARRAVHRHAHAHAAGRPARLRLRLARRHQARAAVPAGPARVLRARGRRARPGRPAADAGVRDDRPGHRHEPAPVRALRLGRRARATTAAR